MGSHSYFDSNFVIIIETLKAVKKYDMIKKTHIHINMSVIAEIITEQNIT